jgi:hypothetical protein
MVIHMNDQRRGSQKSESLGRADRRPRAPQATTMRAPEIRKKRNAAWHRAMTGARKQAIGMLERLGPDADHLPEDARKEAHAKLVKELKRVVDVIDRHLREAQREAVPRRKAVPGPASPRGRNRS